MILRNDGEVESISDESKCENISRLKDVDDVEYVVNGEFVVIMRFLNTQVSEKDVE
jgi:hypothetical protein